MGAWEIIPWLPVFCAYFWEIRASYFGVYNLSLESVKFGAFVLRDADIWLLSGPRVSDERCFTLLLIPVRKLGSCRALVNFTWDLNCRIGCVIIISPEKQFRLFSLGWLRGYFDGVYFLAISVKTPLARNSNHDARGHADIRTSPQIFRLQISKTARLLMSKEVKHTNTVNQDIDVH